MPSDATKKMALRRGPRKWIGCETNSLTGNPDPKHISTSFVERQNLTMRMSMRRFTRRLTNAFSKKLENHMAAMALHFMYYNLARVHQTLRISPAMAAGVTAKLWDVEDIVGLLDSSEPSLSVSLQNDTCENSNMAGRGGFRNGAGRKSNASRMIEAGFVAPWFTAEFQEFKWKSFLESDDQRIALDAAKYLTDRLFGKASQSVDMNHSGSLGLAEAIAEGRKRAALRHET